MPPGQASGGVVAAVAQRLKPGDRVDVALAGQLIIEGGMVKVRQTAYDANRHAVQVTAVAHSNSVREVSVDISDGGQYRGYTFEAIANKVLAQVGVSLQLVNPSPAASIPFRNVIVQTGEAIGELLERLARQRGLWMWTDVDGTILAGNPAAASSGGATLVEGVNIVAANSYIEYPGADDFVMYSQTSGSDDLWGRRAAEIGAKATILGGDPNKTIIGLAEYPCTLQELQTRTDHEVHSIAADTHRDVITHKGWFRPGTTSLWKEGDWATVKSPLLYPFDNGQQTMRVWAVTCSQNNESGTTTQVELVNQATFEQTNPDASAPNPYATPATPKSAA